MALVESTIEKEHIPMNHGHGQMQYNEMCECHTLVLYMSHQLHCTLGFKGTVKDTVQQKIIIRKNL